MISGKPSFSLTERLQGKIPFLFLALGLFLAVDAIYGRFLWNPLVFDDFYVFDGKTLQKYEAFKFTLRWFPYASFEWTEKILGPMLMWQRLGNLILHFITCFALFLFLRRLFGIVIRDGVGLSVDWLAFFAALIFALEPASVYAVGYLVERSIVMSTLFGILVLWSYLEGLEKRNSVWFLVSAVCYFLSVFSKEHAIMMPAVALAMTFLVRKPSMGWIRELWLPFLLFSIIGILVVLKAKGVLGKPYEVYGASMIQSQKIEVDHSYPLSVITQCWLYFKYLFLWVVPDTSLMSIDMREPFARGFFSFPQFPGLLLFLIYPAISIRLLLKGGRAGLAGFGLIFPWLLFMTELTTVRIQESFVLYRSYLWMAGFFAILPVFFFKISARATFAILLAASIGLFPLARNRIVTFSSPLLLWKEAADHVEGRKDLPGLDRIYYNVGLSYLGIGDYGHSVEYFSKSIEISPQIYQIWYNRAYANYFRHKFREAIPDLDHSLSISPNYADAYFLRALTYRHLQDERSAMADFGRACQLGKERACEKLQEAQGEGH